MRRGLTKFGQQMTEGNWRDRMAVIDSANRFLGNCPIKDALYMNDNVPVLFMSKKELGIYLKENNGKPKKLLRAVR